MAAENIQGYTRMGSTKDNSSYFDDTDQIEQLKNIISLKDDLIKTKDALIMAQEAQINMLLDKLDCK